MDNIPHVIFSVYVNLSNRTYEDSQVSIEYVVLKPKPGSPECYVFDVRLKGGNVFDSIAPDKAPPEVSIPQLAVAYIINVSKFYYYKGKYIYIAEPLFPAF